MVENAGETVDNGDPLEENFDDFFQAASNYQDAFAYVPENENIPLNFISLMTGGSQFWGKTN